MQPILLTHTLEPVSGEERLMPMSGKSRRGLPAQPSSEEEEDSEQGRKLSNI